MKYKENWEAAQTKWINYWKHQNTGRPLMCVIARKPEIEALSSGKPVYDGEIMCQGKQYGLPEDLQWKDMEDKYRNADRMVARYRYFCETHEFMAESFPNLDIDFGPGSLAAYLGSEIGFKPDTVWFEQCIDDDDEWDDVPAFQFDPDNKWYKEHIALAKRCRELAGDDFPVDIPDLMENVDVLASLRGTQNLLMDMAADPDAVKERVKQITDLYYDYYDSFYNAVKATDNSSAYTVFQIWGPGRTVKLQCDLSAMISPDYYRDFVLDSLKTQSAKADSVLYHLDGPDAIRHLDAVMEVEGIDALQWTSGDSGPDGTLPDWDVIYDKAVAAGKSIWVKVYSGDFEDWLKNCERLVMKYGSHSLFFLFPEMSHEQAERLISYADEHWSNIRGTFVEGLDAAERK
jgi:hypothetical protein